MTRAGIKFFIEQDPHIKVIAEAGNGEEGISMCSSYNPDVVLMDVHMPVLNGIEAAKTITKSNANTKIIMLTALGDEKEIMHSFSAGANGYCLKDISDSRLIAAIRSVAAGDIWLDSSIAGCLLRQLPLPKASVNGDKQSDNFGLSEREMQVIALMVEGKTNQKIASELFLSVDTVKGHLKTIMDKLSVNDRTQAAVKAVRKGLV